MEANGLGLEIPGGKVGSAAEAVEAAIEVLGAWCLVLG